METRKNIPSTSLVSLSDIYTIAYLMAIGEKYSHIERSTSSGKIRIKFYFNLNVKKKIDEFFNGGTVSAIKYKNAIENIKSLIYDH